MNLYKNDEYEILTPNGFKDFDGVSVCIKEALSFQLNEEKLTATADHKILLDEIWTEVQNLPVEITSVGKIEVYDPINVRDGSSYISNGLVSHNCSMIYIDEQAFIEGWIKFSTSVLPTISSGKKTKLLFTSTPQGYNHFHKYCIEAQRGTNGFKYFEIPWFMVPGRDEAWKKKVMSDLNNDEQLFAQEYSCSFLGSVLTLIATNKLKSMVYSIPQVNSTDEVKVYVENINPYSTYILPADVSQGKGLDYHAFSVIDISQQPYEQVATFRNNMCSPLEYAEIIYRTAKKFNNAYVLIELNDLGGQVANSLAIDLEYENLIYSMSKGRLGQIASLYQEKAEPGVKTSITTKAVGCNMLKLMVEKDVLHIVDADTIDELTTFVRSDKARGSFCAQEGKHDDTITPLFLFGWLTNNTLFTDLTNVEMRTQLREQSINEIELMSSPIGLINGGSSDGGMGTVDRNVWEPYVQDSGSQHPDRFNQYDDNIHEKFDSNVWERC